MVLSMDRWKGKVAVVTGASSGIGAAVTEKLIAEGVIVVGLARRKEKLQELSLKLKDKRENFYFIETDITKEEDIIKAFVWIKTNVGHIHILVNSAGLFVIGTLSDGETELWRQVFDTNVLGLCIATREAVKDMRENNIDGHIIHVNSAAGHSVTTWQMNVYSASKHAVTALTETLRQELNSVKSNIKISSISPAYVSTDMVSASATATGIPVTGLWEHWRNNTLALNPEDVVNGIIYMLATPPHAQVHEMKMRALF